MARPDGAGEGLREETAPHSVEDTAYAIALSTTKALADKKGINRYGFFLLPMDDALVRVALDFSGRPFLNWKVRFPTSTVGTFDLELVREFFNSFSIKFKGHIYKIF